MIIRARTHRAPHLPAPLYSLKLGCAIIHAHDRAGLKQLCYIYDAAAIRLGRSHFTIRGSFSPRRAKTATQKKKSTMLPQAIKAFLHDKNFICVLLT